MYLCCFVIGIIVILFAGLVYSLYVPVPPGTKLSKRLFFTMIKAMDRTGTVLEWAGIADRLVVFKAMMALRIKFKPKSTGGLLYAEVQAEDTEFDGIKVRIYTPNEQTSEAGVVFIHGGGFCLGNRDGHDELCRKVAFDMGAVVMSIEYRLAPKHPFPAAIEDCVTATKHFLKTTASQYGVDAHKVAVMGDSAGGNLSAAVCLVLRDERFSPALKAQVLIYPSTQAVNFNLPSHQQNSKGPIISLSFSAGCVARYAAGQDGTTYDVTNKLSRSEHVPADIRRNLAKSKLDLSILPDEFRPIKANPEEPTKGDEKLWNKIKDAILDQRFSPLLADDLSSLPAAFVFTAQYDVLRDEGIMYAQRLRQVGNDVTWSHSSVGYHGMLNEVKAFRKEAEPRKQYEKIIVFLKEKLV